MMNQTPVQRIYYQLRSAARFNKNFLPLNQGNEINDGTVRDFERLVRNGHHSRRDMRHTLRNQVAILEEAIHSIPKFPA